jgi:hypothetical protein
MCRGWERRGNNGNGRRSFAFARAFGRRLPALNHALWANISELARTLLRFDKLGVTGSSPVPPIQTWAAMRDAAWLRQRVSVVAGSFW